MTASFVLIIFLAVSFCCPLALKNETEISPGPATLKKLKGAKLIILSVSFLLVIHAIGLGIIAPDNNLYCSWGFTSL